MADTSEGGVGVKLERGFMSILLTNTLVREVQHEKELLGKSYVETLQKHCPCNISLHNVDEQLEKRLRSLCTAVESQYKKLKTRDKPNFLLRQRNVTIGTAANACTQADNEGQRDYVASESLVETLQKLLDKKIAENEQQKATITSLTYTVESGQAQNKALTEQMSRVAHDALMNDGKRVGEGCKRTDKRKLEVLSNSVESTLEDLLSSYGLNLRAVTVEDLKGFVHRILYRDSEPALVQSMAQAPFHGGRKTSFHDLSQSDQTIVRDVASLLDEYTCSTSFWQELSRTVKGLPSVNLLNSYTQMLDERIEVVRTPGKAAGAQVSFLKELDYIIVEMAKEQNKTLLELSTTPLLVKIEGDGSRVSSQTSWTTLSFVVIQAGKQLQSHKLHRLLALAAISENYFSLRESFEHIIQEINHVVETRQVVVGGVNIPIKICLGSDLKFILIVMGLLAASSKYPCPFCCADAKDRADPALPSEHFNSPPFSRTLGNLETHCDALSHGVQLTALFKIEPESVVPDTLHMCLRVVNRLLDNLVIEMEDFDCEEKVRNPRAMPDHLAMFVKLVNSCGVKFAVWQDERKGRVFTSLSGNECHLLLQYLPEKLRGLLHRDTELSVIALWQTFQTLLTHFERNTSGENVEDKARTFFKTFIELGNTARKGYGGNRVTPYIHIVAHHAAAKHVQYGCLGWFSSQGLEKKNDVLKTLHHGKSNKWNPVADALKLAKRSEVVSESTGPRSYRKVDTVYWREGGIKDSRNGRQRSAPDPPTMVAVEVNVDQMSAGELRTELRSLNVNTTVKCPRKLREMLRKAMSNTGTR